MRAAAADLVGAGRRGFERQGLRRVRALPYTEDSPLAARHPYEVSKAFTDLLAQSYPQSYGLPVAIARCGNVYGGGDLNWSRIVPGTVRAFLRDERPVIRSDGTFVRDYLYVHDVATAYLRSRRWRRTAGSASAPSTSVTNLPSPCSSSSGDLRAIGIEAIEPEILDCGDR